MSSEESSEQLFVLNGAGYNEVYLSGQHDPSTSYDKRDSSANSPYAEEDEDLDMIRLEGDSGGDSSSGHIYYAEPPIQSIIGPYGLREFLLLLLWMVNEFKSSVKAKHFETLRERYQIPVSIPIRLPFKYEKCYYRGAEDIGVYE